jgi:hypothetical protein
MSELVSQGENDLLVFFQEYLLRRPEGVDSPVTIKAKDLDKNYKLATVINDPDKDQDNRSYTVEYREEGTVLKNIGGGLPPNAIAKQFYVCENGQPKQYWFVVWDEEPEIP